MWWWICSANGGIRLPLPPLIATTNSFYKAAEQSRTICMGKRRDGVLYRSMWSRNCVSRSESLNEGYCYWKKFLTGRSTNCKCTSTEHDVCFWFNLWYKTVSTLKPDLKVTCWSKWFSRARQKPHCAYKNSTELKGHTSLHGRLCHTSVQAIGWLTWNDHFRKTLCLQRTATGAMNTFINDGSDDRWNLPTALLRIRCLFWRKRS